MVVGPAGAEGLATALAGVLREAGWQVARLIASGAEDEDTFDAAFDAALAESGELGGIVLLAPLSNAAPLDEGDAAGWAAPLFEPLALAFLTARRATDELMGSGEGGHFLVVVSAPLHSGTIAATQQAALVALARSIATEYGRSGIACNTVVVPQDEADAEAAAEMARFFFSEDASYVTAEVVLTAG